MNAKHYFLSCFAVLFVLGSYGLCMAQDQTATLTVREIIFKADKSGKEKVAVLCNQACVPALSGLEGKKPRIIMDFAGVSFMEPKYRKVTVSGKHVKKIRSYLDHNAKKLRVVLDMAPSKHYIVRAAQDQAVTTFSVSIAEKRRAKGQAAGMKGSRISIVDRTARPIEKDSLLEKAAEKQKPASDAKVPVKEPVGEARPPVKEPVSEARPPVKEPASSARAPVDEKPKLPLDRSTADRGRSQMNAGDYKGAIHTFTQIIAENPKDSLSYRLRGNAYQNIGERQKAIEDWTAAARLGDPVIQSYLDHMQINWKEAPKK